MKMLISDAPDPIKESITCRQIGLHYVFPCAMVSLTVIHSLKIVRYRPCVVPLYWNIEHKVIYCTKHHSDTDFEIRYF